MYSDKLPVNCKTQSHFVNANN